MEILTGLLLGVALAATGMNTAVLGPWLGTNGVIGAEIGAGLGRPEYAVARILGAVLWPVLGQVMRGVPGELVVIAAVLTWGLLIKRQTNPLKGLLALTLIGGGAFAVVFFTGSMLPAVFALSKERTEAGSAGSGLLSGVIGACWYGVPVKITTTALRGSSEFASGICDSLTFGLALAGLGERSALNAFVDVRLDTLSSVVLVISVAVIALGLSRIKCEFQFGREIGLATAAAVSIFIGHPTDLLWMGGMFALGNIVDGLAGPEFRFAGFSAVPVLGQFI